MLVCAIELEAERKYTNNRETVALLAIVLDSNLRNAVIRANDVDCEIALVTVRLIAPERTSEAVLLMVEVTALLIDFIPETVALFAMLLVAARVSACKRWNAALFTMLPVIDLNLCESL